MPPRLFLSFALLISACSDKSAATDDTAGSSGLRTLDNCTTNIDEDAADFYKDLFRCVTITVADGATTIQTVDLPPHLSPYYDPSNPNYTEFDTQGGDRVQNPNTLAEQDTLVIVVDEPTAIPGLEIDEQLVDRMAGDSDSEYHTERTPGNQGIALDGTIEFTGLAAPGDDIAVEAHTFDSYEAHPEDRGTYHYHGYSPGPLEVLERAGLVTDPTPGNAEVELFGIMCDGTLVLGCTEMDGSAADDSDFDAQNGHVGDIVSPDGTTYFTARYHVHACEALGDAFSPEIQYYTSCNGA